MPTERAVDRCMAELKDLETPALLLDRAKLEANWARLSGRIAKLGPTLRLHVKTAKSVDLVRRLHGGVPAPITVSTLKEAEVFAAAGYRDILYGVAIAPSKLSRAIALARSGVRLKVVADSVELATAIAGSGLEVLIEIDCDGHRAGLRPADPQLVEVANALSRGGAIVAGDDAAR